MAIASGKTMGPLSQLMDGGRATWFLPSAEPLTARKRWIAGSLTPTGTITVDAGAVRALRDGRSDLPAGVIAVSGDFGRGDAVTVSDADGVVLGQGLSAYGADDARAIMGHRSNEIEQILGYRGRDAMIHRDDLVLNS